MTQIEQIKAEIERLKAEIPYHENAWSVLNKLKEFINSLPAEPSEDVEEAANIYANKQGLELKPFAIKFFKSGAQWQKEQMMKSAVDATCVILPPPDLFKVLICHEVTDKLADKQKIKILIVKEDEQ